MYIFIFKYILIQSLFIYLNTKSVYWNRIKRTILLSEIFVCEIFWNFRVWNFVLWNLALWNFASVEFCVCGILCCGIWRCGILRVWNFACGIWRVEFCTCGIWFLHDHEHQQEYREQWQFWHCRNCYRSSFLL